MFRYYPVAKAKMTGGGKCIEQTTKKYQTRDSPPYKAYDCKGEEKLGNDRNKWKSVLYNNNTYRWKKIKTGKTSNKQLSVDLVILPTFQKVVKTKPDYSDYEYDYYKYIKINSKLKSILLSKRDNSKLKEILLTYGLDVKGMYIKKGLIFVSVTVSTSNEDLNLSENNSIKDILVEDIWGDAAGDTWREGDMEIQKLQTKRTTSTIFVDFHLLKVQNDFINQTDISQEERDVYNDSINYIYDT